MKNGSWIIIGLMGLSLVLAGCLQNMQPELPVTTETPVNASIVPTATILPTPSASATVTIPADSSNPFSEKEISEIYMTADYALFEAQVKESEARGYPLSEETKAKEWGNEFQSDVRPGRSSKESIKQFAGCETRKQNGTLGEYQDALCKATFIVAGNDLSMFAFETKGDAEQYLGAIKNMAKESTLENTSFEEGPAGECFSQKMITTIEDGRKIPNVNVQKKNVVINLYGSGYEFTPEEMCKWITERKSLAYLCSKTDQSSAYCSLFNSEDVWK